MCTLASSSRHWQRVVAAAGASQARARAYSALAIVSRNLAMHKTDNCFFDLQRLRSLHVSVCSACALYLSVQVAVVRSHLQRLRSGCGCSACALVGNACMRLRSIVVVTLAIVIVLFGSACALVVIAALALWSIMYVCVYSSPQLCVATI